MFDVNERLVGEKSREGNNNSPCLEGNVDGGKLGPPKYFSDTGTRYFTDVDSCYPRSPMIFNNTRTIQLKVAQGSLVTRGVGFRRIESRGITEATPRITTTYPPAGHGMELRKGRQASLVRQC